jgi:hypothetical protein
MARNNRNNEQNQEDGQEFETIENSIPNLTNIDYDTWWTLTQKKLNLSKDLKISVKKHFEARGFLKSRNFDAGLADFGIKA